MVSPLSGGASCFGERLKFLVLEGEQAAQGFQRLEIAAA
jgi:hypothetical protein